MLDTKYLDDDKQFALLVSGLEQRGALGKSITMDALNECRENRRIMTKTTTMLYAAQSRKNQLSRDFGARMKARLDVKDLRADIEEITAEITHLETIREDRYSAFMAFWLTVPNMPARNTPVGLTEADNQLRSALPKVTILHNGKGGYDYVTENMTQPPQPVFDFTPLDHVELGQRMGCMDFEQTAKISGSRFVTLSGPLAKLERVLGQWMVDEAVKAGYRETAPPHLVKAEAMKGTGQLPKFEEDLFRVGDMYLIPTAEVSLTNMARDRVYVEGDIAEGLMQHAMVALTPCYRAEAGSAGRDTRGMIRLHQFNKVELVNIILNPDLSDIAHASMTAHVCDVMTKLGLNYQTMVLCGGELGFSARGTFDIEVWMPSQNRYREIASISNCDTFQARRMNARYKPRGSKATEFVSTLNGSGVAVGRALVAVMENYQTEDGGIAIPVVVRDAMGGSFITPDGSII